MNALDLPSRLPVGSPWYLLLSIVALIASAWAWDRASRRRAEWADVPMAAIGFAMLIGAIVGAKLAFLATEGAFYADDPLALLSGRSVTGALLGGVLAAEFAKSRLGVTAPTGDFFAIGVPISLALGRLGCLDAGCCPGIACEASWWTLADGAGVARWPAVPVEILFCLVFAAWALLAAWRGWLPGQRFNVFLVAMGVFRFAHEFARDNHRPLGEGPLALGGYHVMSLLLIACGVWMMRRRARLDRDARPRFAEVAS